MAAWRSRLSFAQLIYRVQPLLESSSVAELHNLSSPLPSLSAFGTVFSSSTPATSALSAHALQQQLWQRETQHTGFAARNASTATSAARELSLDAASASQLAPSGTSELAVKASALPATGLGEFPCNAKAFYLGSRIDLYDLNAAVDQTNYPHSLGRDSTIICLKPRRKKSLAEGDSPTGLPMETYLVAYRYGSVVIVNGAGKEAHVLELVRRHTASPVAKEFSEEFKIVIQPDLPTSSRCAQDKIALQQLSFDNIKTVAHVLGQSVALDYYARQAEQMLAVFCEMNQEMQRTGNFANVGKRDLLKLVAENNVIATDIISKLGVNERFDLAWKSAEYHVIYQHLRDELEMIERFDNMNQKLELVQENLKYLLEIMQNKKSDTLEWTIIVLIAVEICISCYEIYTGMS